MNTKVENYINQDKFTKQTLSNMFCYQDFSQQDESFFSYDEQIELFEYFIKKREERILFSFTFWNDYTLAKTPSFLQIQSIIKDTLSLKIEELFQKEQLAIEECFDFLDYVNSLSEVMDVDTILKYFNHGLSQFKEIMKQNNDTDYENYIQSFLDTLVYILKNACIDINDEIIIELTELKDIINNKYFDALQSMYTSLILFQHPEGVFIGTIYRDILLFILKSSNVFKKIYHSLIINKIEDLELLKEFLNRFFPEKQESYNYHHEQFDIIFLITDRLKQLNIGIEDILHSYLNNDQKEELLKYIGYQYHNYIDKPLEIDIASNKINIDYLKQPLHDYILKLSSDPNFEFNWANTIHWCTYIFKDLINTPELYYNCSDSAKELYNSLVDNEKDALWQFIPQERKDQVLEHSEKGKRIQDKKEQIVELRKNKKIACVNDFFDKGIDFIKDEFNQIKEYFGKSLITHNDIYSYKNNNDFVTWSEIDEFLKKDIVILNAFLIQHLYDMYYFLREDQNVDYEINIDDIFEKLSNNWEQYWGLYLYNYLINIKEYNFKFTPEQKEKLRVYFTTLQDDKTIPIYVYWYLEKLFHSSITLTEHTIIQLFKMNY